METVHTRQEAALHQDLILQPGFPKQHSNLVFAGCIKGQMTFCVANAVTCRDGPTAYTKLQLSFQLFAFIFRYFSYLCPLITPQLFSALYPPKIAALW